MQSLLDTIAARLPGIVWPPIIEGSAATVLALFLLPNNLDKLKGKFQRLKPGTRIVTNGFPIDGWTAKETATVEGDCGPWCTAYLYVVGESISN